MRRSSVSSKQQKTLISCSIILLSIYILYKGKGLTGDDIWRCVSSVGDATDVGRHLPIGY